MFVLDMQSRISAFYVNHTQNDWVEFAVDGGIPFLFLVLIFLASASSPQSGGDAPLVEFERIH